MATTEVVAVVLASAVIVVLVAHDSPVHIAICVNIYITVLYIYTCIRNQYIRVHNDFYMLKVHDDPICLCIYIYVYTYMHLCIIPRRAAMPHRAGRVLCVYRGGVGLTVGTGGEDRRASGSTGEVARDDTGIPSIDRGCCPF